MNAAITHDVEISTPSQDLYNKATGRIGELLSQARQAKQLDISVVAQKLRLSVATIKALEQNQLDKMQVVFIRGYIKKYVRLLEINETELPDLPNQEIKISPLRSSTYLAEQKHEISSNHIIIKIATWVIVLGLISLVGLWWLGQLEWENTESLPSSLQVESSNNTISIAKPITLPASSLTLSNTTSELPNTTVSVSELPVNNASSPVKTAPTPPPNQSTPTPPQTPAQPTTTPTLPTPTPTSVQPGQAIAGGIELVSAPATTATSPALPVDNTSQPQIVLKILKSSKVEVTDATDKFKLTGKLHKGEEYKFAGTPPYNIVLERISAVKLTIDGKPFKIKSSSRKGNANFVLDPAKLSTE